MVGPVVKCEQKWGEKNVLSARFAPRRMESENFLGGPRIFYYACGYSITLVDILLRLIKIFYNFIKKCGIFMPDFM